MQGAPGEGISQAATLPALQGLLGFLFVLLWLFLMQTVTSMGMREQERYGEGLLWGCSKAPGEQSLPLGQPVSCCILPKQKVPTKKDSLCIFLPSCHRLKLFIS